MIIMIMKKPEGKERREEEKMKKVFAKVGGWRSLSVLAMVVLLMMIPVRFSLGAEVQIPVNLEGEGDIGKVENLLDKIMTWIVRIGLILGALAFAYGCILWITSGGNDLKIAKAKKALLYSLGGVALLVLSISIISLIVGALGGSFSWNPF